MAANTAEWQIPPVTDETVGRYRANYTIPPSVELTKEMIERHASL
ncbi:MAG TPA: hypothetical protein VG757_10880 [Devosia sp.]|nr:hypothetical protein [Devosia sp.]